MKLSNDFRVLFEIYKNEPISFPDIVKNLGMDKYTVADCITTLDDWGLILSGYEDSGRVYYIHEGQRGRLKKLYDG